MIGGFDVELAHEFFQGFANHALVTLHIDNLRGDNAHHQCETVFKAFARALRMAVDDRPARRRRRAVDQGVALAPDQRHRRAASEPSPSSTTAWATCARSRRRWRTSRRGERAPIRGRRDRRARRGRRRRARRAARPGRDARLHARAARVGLQEAVLEAAATKPLLGVCIGMQMLLDRSEEGADAAGTPGPRPDRRRGRALPARRPRCSPTAAASRCRRWAGTRSSRRSRTRCGTAFPTPAWFYFVHSYYARPSDPRHSAANTDYGGRFTSALARDNIFATQFHPEKSAAHGLALYRNFVHWNP